MKNKHREFAAKLFGCSEESGTDYMGLCHWRPPAVLARLFGYKDQYDVEPAPTHEEWSCSEFEEADD